MTSNRTLKITEQEKTERKKTILLVTGIVILGAISRAPTVALGPLLHIIRESLDLNYALAGMIMTIPIIALGLGSIPISNFIESKGISLPMITGLLIYGASLLIRSLGDIGSLLLGTFLVGLGMAFINILASVIIKEKFPLQIGIITGVFTTTMYLFAAISSAIAVPVCSLLNSWQLSLAFWFPLVIVTIIMWMIIIKRNGYTISSGQKKSFGNIFKLLKLPLARWITILMASQSIIYFCSLSWLPSIIQEAGFSDTTAGFIASLVQLAGIPSATISGAVVYKFKNQQIPCVFVAFTFMVSIFLMAYAKTISGFIICAVFLGFSMAASYTLYLCVLTLRARDSIQAGQLAGITSLFGYLITALSPSLMGLVYDLAGNWIIPLCGLVISAFFYGLSGFKSGKNVSL